MPETPILPVGTHVRYWTGLREGDGKTSHTRSGIEMLGGHTPVVWVEGESSCIAMTHVQPVDVYPCQIGVFCDRCGTTAERDYLVSDYDDQPMRFSYARRHLNANEGWSCTDASDLCPACKDGAS